jgi:uncharacterized lipoprotein YddW (UPF0748 family)
MRSFLAQVVVALLFAGTLPAAEVLLIQATLSAPDHAERNYARRLTETCSAWLSELHVPHTVTTDDALSSRKLRSAKLAILVYNPDPPTRELELLQRFVKRGGKLIVFYSADPGLAETMGMKLGEYRVAQRQGAWSAFRFRNKGPSGLPTRVLQTSRNIRPVYAIENRSQVLAEWEDRSGAPTGDPAWLMSDQGFWMTHVLLDDGDTWNKQRMLLAMVGACDPTLWPTAARGLLSEAGTLGKFQNIQDAQRSLMTRAAISRVQKDISSLLSRARKAHVRAGAALQRGAHAEVVVEVRKINTSMAQAYCHLLTPRQPAFVGVWNHSGQGLYPGDWPHTCRILEAHQVTDVFPNVVNPSQAHYDSELVPGSYAFRTLGDQLTQSITAAHAQGIKVHAWKVCWRLDRPSSKELQKMKSDKRLQITRAGVAIPWLCPSVTQNRKLEKDAIREIVRKYEVDGIHLDYIRYANSQVCYCTTCKKAFEATIGRSLIRWPEAVTEDKLKQQFVQWRAGQITRFVQDVSVLARKIRPGIQVSAAVYGRYPLCVASVGQDWGTWLERGYIDFACPMNYTTDLDAFALWTRDQLALPGADGRLFPGIGVTATESKLTPVQVVDQISALQRLGASGYLLFDLNRKLETEILPVLRSNPPSPAKD